MPIKIDEKKFQEGLKEVKELSRNSPKYFRKARKSALQSCGYYMKLQIQNFIEYGGVKPDLHVITRNFRISKGKLRKRSSALAPVPLFKLGKTSGYQVKDQGSEIRTGIGIKKTKVNADVLRMLAKHQKGYIRTPSKAERKLLNKALIKLGKKPLRRSTTTFRIPSREVMSIVLNQTKDYIPKLYNDRFFRKIESLVTGKDTKTTKVGL